VIPENSGSPDNPSLSPAVGTQASPWPIRDIAIGLVLLSVYAGCGLAAQHSPALRYRPWFAVHFVFIVELVFFASLIAYAVSVCRKRGAWPLLQSLQPATIAREALQGVVSVLVTALAVGTAIKLLEVLFKTQRSVDPVLQWLQSAPNTYLSLSLLIMAVSIGPVAEEFFFRGFLYNALKTRMPLWAAAVIQAAIFSVLHNYGFFNSIGVFLLGVAFVIVYERRKTILAPIVVHILFNALMVVPLLFLTIQNHHTAASTWEEAHERPAWLSLPTEQTVARQQDGREQVEYAIATWGSKGTRQWKREALAFTAVSDYFPRDRTACAKAKLGLVEIYAKHLLDYRRAIVEADDLLAQYPDQKEQYVSALLKKGYAYLMLRDPNDAVPAFQKVLAESGAFADLGKSAQAGIEWANYLQGRS
jgi:membrane protease YdiL (CAAX protease family)